MFNYVPRVTRDKKGNPLKVFAVEGNNVDSTMSYKDELKKQFGAVWIGSLKTWGWFTPDDPTKRQTLINNRIKPAITFLREKEIEHNPMLIDDAIKQVMDALDSSDSQEETDAQMNVFMSQEEIEEKLQQYKEELVNAVSSEDFKKLFEPVIRAMHNNGYEFSLHNSLLMTLQDPKATIVKNASDWGQRPFYRAVLPGSPAIGLLVPVGGKALYNGHAAKEREKRRWLTANGYRSEAEVRGGDIEVLRKHLEEKYDHTGYELKYYFYDIRFTRVIPGMENEAHVFDSSPSGGKPKDDIAWYNDSGKETAAVKEKIDASLQVVKDSGVDVSSKPNLRGALGVSKGGKIEVLDKAKMNSNYLLTILHEFAHELLHQTYLRDKNNPEFAQFYFGRPEGKNLVEQQAELTGWIVCRFYGYNIKESINYAGIWGMRDAKQAVYAFDTVAKVSNFLIDRINRKIKENKLEGAMLGIEESKGGINEVQYTGADIARMVGAEDVYNQGLQQIEQEEQMKVEAMNKFKNMVNKINECDKKRTQEVID